MNYKLLPDTVHPDGTTEPHQCILRVADNTSIVINDANPAYQEYLAWLAEGNEPLPADDPAT